MAEFTDKPGYSFDPGPPPEASRFLKNKVLKPAFSWKDVEPEEHAVAFSVAKAMQVDVLQDIRDEVQRALDEGRTFAQFKRDLRPTLQKKGWWGVKDMVDPISGKTRSVQLGSARRLKTIYRSNLRSARTAGQWERIQRTKKALPFLLYQLGPSERHRPEHRAKEGLILPVDDPFWLTWYPPNGWGCKCWVRQITKREADTLPGLRQAPKTPMKDWRNARTGEIKRIPVGIDPSWEGNPGAARQARMEQFLVEKMAAADPMIARVVARDIASSWRAERMMAGEATGTVPIGVLPEGLRKAVGTQTPIVQIRDDVAAKIREKHPEVAARHLLDINEAIEKAPATMARDASGSAPRLLLRIDGDRPIVLAVKPLVEKNELWVASIYESGARYWARMLNRPGTELLR